MNATIYMWLLAGYKQSKGTSVIVTKYDAVELCQLCVMADKAAHNCRALMLRE